MEEYLSKFIEWAKLKIKIHISNNSDLSFKNREIWWASMGVNIGSEQNGKNAKFERPVLVFRKFGQHMFWAVPLTTKEKGNLYHYKFNYKVYSEDDGGNLNEEVKEGTMILSQLKTMSSKRLLRKMGVVPGDEFNKVREKLRKLL